MVNFRNRLPSFSPPTQLIPESAHRKLVYPTRGANFSLPRHFWLFSGSKVTPAPPRRDLNFSGKLQTHRCKLKYFPKLEHFLRPFPLTTPFEKIRNQASNTSYFPSSLATLALENAKIFRRENVYEMECAFAGDWRKKVHKIAVLIFSSVGVLG